MSSVATALDLSLSLAGDLAARRMPERAVAVPGVRPASALEVRPAPEMVDFGIAALDRLTGGAPRGGLTEICGPASSGRTSVVFSLIAEVTRRQEVCALVDVSDSFDPASAEAAGVDLKRLLWVRCGKTNQPQGDRGLGSPMERPRAQKLSQIVPGPRTMTCWTSSSSVEQSITSGCFEAAHGTRETVSSIPKKETMNGVAPPAKNISWSIHENYDTRLRHAMLNRGEKYEPPTEWRIRPQPGAGKRTAPVIGRKTPQEFSAMRKAKWDRLDQALKATDLLIQSGGFGLIVVDLGDISPEQARRIPLTSWFRFRRAVENTPTILLVIARTSCAKTCASLVMQFSADPQKSESRMTRREPLTHVCLLDGLNVRVELLRTRLERKPVRSVTTNLETRTLWKKTG